ILGYLLSKKEQKAGSPEKPLSALGLLSYRSYWKTVLYRQLKKLHDENPRDLKISIEDLSEATSLTVDDVVTTLQTCDIIRTVLPPKKQDTKGKGKYIRPGSLKNVKPIAHELVVDWKEIEEHCKKVDAKGQPKTKESLLRWTPFLFQ